MIDIKKLKGFNDIVANLNPYGHSLLIEVCRSLRDVYPDTDIVLREMVDRPGVKVLIFDGAEVIDMALCPYSKLNAAPGRHVLDKQFMDHVDRFVADMEFEEPMDGDETAALAEYFLFLLDEKNGNLTKEELGDGYEKWRTDENE